MNTTLEQEFKRQNHIRHVKRYFSFVSARKILLLEAMAETIPRFPVQHVEDQDFLYFLQFGFPLNETYLENCYNIF